MRKDKREWAKNIAQEAENGAKHEQMKAVYAVTRGLSASLLRELTRHLSGGTTEVERTPRGNAVQNQPRAGIDVASNIEVIVRSKLKRDKE